MKLRLWVLACVVALGAIFPASALAQKPMEPVEVDPVQFPAGEVCAFAVELEPLVNKLKMKTFSSGRMMITGTLKARVTNLHADPDRSMVVNISGRVTITPLPNGNARVVAAGRQLLIFFATDIGGPGLFLTVGRGLSLIDTNENLISFQQSGRMIDVCAALA